jgi:hypothetical protein
VGPTTINGQNGLSSWNLTVLRWKIKQSVKFGTKVEVRAKEEEASNFQDQGILSIYVGGSAYLMWL